MASSANAALCAVVATAFWASLGFAIVRSLLPRALALGAAPVVGWGARGHTQRRCAANPDTDRVLCNLGGAQLAGPAPGTGAATPLPGVAGSQCCEPTAEERSAANPRTFLPRYFGPGFPRERSCTLGIRVGGCLCGDRKMTRSSASALAVHWLSFRTCLRAR
jgi:hypothetical protein